MLPQEHIAQEAQKQVSTASDSVAETVLSMLDIGTQTLTTSEIAPDTVIPAITEAASTLSEGIQGVAAEGASIIVEAAAELFSGLL